MKPFDHGGAPHAFAGAQHMAASSGQFCSAHLFARRDFCWPRGLKEGILPENAEKRILHCTHGATLCFTAKIAQILHSQGVLNNSQAFSVPHEMGGFIHSKRKINASDESPETMAGATERADSLSRAHKKLKEIAGCNSFQQEDNGFSHVSASFYESVALRSHLGVSLVSSQNTYCCSSSTFACLPASHIPRAFVLHISGDEQENQFCIEDPEAPLTPDLQPEARSWDCEALCTTGAERMLPADTTGVDDLALGENACKEDADDILLVHKLVLKEEDIVSSRVVQCPGGKECSTELKLSYKSSSGLLCDDSKSISGKYSFRELSSHACRQYMAQQLSACLTIPGNPAACSNKLPEFEHAHLMVNNYLDRSVRRLCTAGRIIVIMQEEMLAMLWVLTQKCLAQRSANIFWLRCLYPQQETEGRSKLKECSSNSPSKVSIMSGTNSPDLCGIDWERLPMRTKSARELMPAFKEYLAESYGSSLFALENGPAKIMEVADDMIGIPNEHVGQSLETCYPHLQAPPALNIKCSNGDMIEAKDNRVEASSLQVSAAVHGPCSPTLSQCSLSSDLSKEGWKSSVLHGEVHERRSRAKFEQFAEIFLLRRHIKQQQQRAQQAPPYLCRESAWFTADAERPTNIVKNKFSPCMCSLTIPSMKSSENMKREPTMILTPTITRPYDASPRFCDHGICVGADVVIDIVGLVDYIEKRSSKLETFTDAAVNSIRCTHIPFTGGQIIISNVNAVIVTIAAIMVYTKILLEGALSWVGRSQIYDSEDKK